MCINFGKNGLSYVHFGRFFFTNSSGHPAAIAPIYKYDTDVEVGLARVIYSTDIFVLEQILRLRNLCTITTPAL
jgi:hypothetical protein